MSTLQTINSTDAITTSRTDINNNFGLLNSEKEEVSNKSTDSTFASASDTTYPTTLATKAYVDAGGNVNASTITKGISELATSAEITAGSATGGTGAAIVVTPDALKASQVPIIRTYLNASSPATWTKPAGLKYVVVEVQAGGGGSGGTTTGSTATGGGGGGGYSRKVIAAASLGITETVTIGAGGTAGAAAGGAGGTGGSSSFGTHATATGGDGGATGSGASLGGTGGVGSNGDVNTYGSSGGLGTGDASAVAGGAGGASALGGGGKPNGTASTGSAVGSVGLVYGGGGGGSGVGSGAADTAGALGAPGIVIVTEYYV